MLVYINIYKRRILNGAIFFNMMCLLYYCSCKHCIFRAPYWINRTTTTTTNIDNYNASNRVHPFFLFLSGFIFIYFFLWRLLLLLAAAMCKFLYSQIGRTYTILSYATVYPEERFLCFSSNFEWIKTKRKNRPLKMHGYYVFDFITCVDSANTESFVYW